MSPIQTIFESLRKNFNLNTDAALAAKLEMTPPTISKLRSGKLKAGPSMILRIHDLTGWAIRDIKGAFGLPCLPRHKA